MFLPKQDIQVQYTYTFPVDSPIGLLTVHLLYNTCELTTGLHFMEQKKKFINSESGFSHDVVTLLHQ